MGQRNLATSTEIAPRRTSTAVSTSPFALAFAFAFLTGHGGLSAQAQLAKLTATDGNRYDFFGTSVALKGTVAVVGAHGHDGCGVACSSGGAYVFRSIGGAWTNDGKLLESDAEAQDLFGLTVATGGDVIAVGAPGHDEAGDSAGAVYVFRYQGGRWVEEAKLVAGDAEGDEAFGASVATSGDVIVVGAPFDDDSGIGAGSAYIFRYDGATWTQEQKLFNSNPEPFDGFGTSVSIDGATTVIGAALFSDIPVLPGKAVVFRYDGALWIEQQVLMASDGDFGDTFGAAVSVRGDWIIVGAWGDDDICPADRYCDSGSAYIFQNDGATWVEDQKLIPSDSVANDSFGVSVAMGDGVALVGATGNTFGTHQTGSAYLFAFSGNEWIEDHEIFAEDADLGDSFGRSVALDTTTALIGAPWDDDACADLPCESGSAYLFAIADTPFLRGDFNGDGVLHGLVDGLEMLAFQFQDGLPPLCLEAADADGNGSFNGLVDALRVLAHQFQGGPPPPEPYPNCGQDPDAALSLGCGVNACQ